MDHDITLWRRIRDFINKKKPDAETLKLIAFIVGYQIKEDSYEKRS